MTSPNNSCEGHYLHVHNTTPFAFIFFKNFYYHISFETSEVFVKHSTISSLSITYHIMKLSYGREIRELLW